MLSFASPLLDMLDGLGPDGTIIKTLLAIASAVFVGVTTFKSVTTIPRGSVGVKERNGKPVRHWKGYRHTLKIQRPFKKYYGLYVLIPYLENMRSINIMEETREPGELHVKIGAYDMVVVRYAMTIVVVEYERFLYRHNDPRMYIDTMSEAMLNRDLREINWAGGEEITAAWDTRFSENINSVAEEYGIQVLKFVIRNDFPSEQMALARAVRESTPRPITGAVVGRGTT